ncbi:MAG: cytochrome-c peroxidase [Myxococcota bacterium]|nr:cytochrome-c peroxidase [Myxococcota bacterium]
MNISGVRSSGMENGKTLRPLVMGSLATLVVLAGLPHVALADGKGDRRGGGRGRIELPEPLTDADFHAVGPNAEEKVELGRMLMFDKILSGNENIACATCHHPSAGTGDGLALPVGEGGFGLGPVRDSNEGEASHVEGRVPRNAPPIFNLAARQFEALFYDGRLAVDFSEPSGFVSPAGDQMPMGCHMDPTPPCVENVLAAQALFPVTSDLEMAGQAHENAIGAAGGAGDFAGPSGVWRLLAERLQAIPEYVDLFKAAFPSHIHSAEDITYVDAANAIAAFEGVTFRTDDSAFDRYLRGQKSALSKDQKRGMRLFYGEAGCGDCHSGSLQTDQAFHALGMPQVGPGKGDGASGLEDFGRFKVTGQPEDLFAFRTPSLRNVAVTGPWGHAGGYSDLRQVVAHHMDAAETLRSYGFDARLALDSDQSATDYQVMQTPTLVDALIAASDAPEVELSDREVDRLMDFLFALTDMRVLTDRSAIPFRVPSGLAVAD